ncbi:MAG: FmdB family zinc ribbon protein [Polyangiales bacterium]
MPLYEFACGRCAEGFEELTSSGAAPPACPRCGQREAVARIPIAKVTIGKKAEDHRPPDIKSFTRPRKW